MKDMEEETIVKLKKDDSALVFRGKDSTVELFFFNSDDKNASVGETLISAISILIMEENDMFVRLVNDKINDIKKRGKLSAMVVKKKGLKKITL